jgi:hypothetical protein
VKADIVERLASILGELEYLPLPSVRVGAALLHALEGMDRIRRVVRAEAKALLTRAPDALPGWRVSRGNGARELELAAGLTPTMMIRTHHRRSAVRLIQRPRILK